MKKLLMILVLSILSITTFINVKASEYAVTDFSHTWSGTDVGDGSWKITTGSPNAIGFDWQNLKSFIWIPDEIFDDFDHMTFGIYNTTSATIDNNIPATVSAYDQIYVLDYSSYTTGDIPVKWTIEIYSNTTPTTTKTEASNYLNAYQFNVNFNSDTYNALNIDNIDSIETAYNQGYTAGEDYGYETGQDDMFDNGSFVYGYAFANAFDYIYGYDQGSQINVNAGITNFTNDFSTWIVPAIVVIILLGGFTTIYAMKKRQRD